MAVLFDKKRNKVKIGREIRQRFGFVEVKAALNPAGEEMFGLIQLAPEYGVELFPVSGRKIKKSARRYYSAALRLNGPQLNLFLTDDKQEQNFWAALSQALPTDMPSQVLLRRRRGELGAHYQSWQEKIQQRLPDPEVGFFFLQDYLDNMIYPVEEAGLTETWAGIFVSGRSETEVAARLAEIMAALPCEATACTSAELSLLLLDYFTPQLAEEVKEQGETPDQLFAHWLAEAGLEISDQNIHNGSDMSFWTLAAPPPQVEGGWTRPLLESEALAESEFDLVVHLAPAVNDKNLGEVLNRRLVALEGMIAEARANRDRAAMRELVEQHHEIENRLNAVMDGSEQYYEVGISLALRSASESSNSFEETSAFEAELNQLGLAPRRVLGADKIEQALLDCAPLNLGRLTRGFVLPSNSIGRLAHIISEGQPDSKAELPIVGITPAGHPIFLDPAAKVGESAFFLLGNSGKATATPARALVEYLAAMRFLDGSAIFGFDPTGEWVSPVRQLGGTYLAIGPERSAGFGWNPLCISSEKLNDLSALEGWVAETTEYLDKLLELNSVEKQNLRPLLLECAIEAVGQGQSVSAETLYERARAGGYRLLTERLTEIIGGGRYHWLFAAPTKLPTPGALNEFCFVGFSPDALEEVNEETRRFYLGRFFTSWVRQLATMPRQSAQPLLVIMDEAQQFLEQTASAQALLWLANNAAKLGISLWALSPRCDEWLLSPQYGQRLFESAKWRFFFNQNGAGLQGAARRIGLPQRALKAIRELGPGAALLHHADGALMELVPLPGDYVTRLISSKPARKQLSVKPETAVGATPAATSAEPKTAARTATRTLVPEPLPISANADLDEVATTSANAANPKTEKEEPIYIFASARGA